MFDTLPEGWRLVNTKQLTAPDKYACVGGPFGSNLVRQDYVEYPGVPVIRGGNLILGSRQFQDFEFVFVSEEKAASLQQNTAYPGDLVFMQRGASIGQVGWIPKDAKFPKYVLSQNLMKLTPDIQKADVMFLCYYFLSPLAQELIQRHSIGSTIPGFNLTQFREFPVLLPPLPEQKAIAHILGTLDDKIELNRQMNQTLEAMAQAIFKSWFVDFDPVRAKMEGRVPVGMDAATADLFPDEFEEMPVGEIPKGWKVGRLDDLLVLQRGFDLSTSQRIPGKYPVITASGPSGTHTEYKVKGPGVVTGRSGLLGKVFFVHEDFWPLNTSLWVKEFRISRPLHAYHLLRGLEFETFNSGSAVPTLNRNHVHSLPIIVPPISLVAAFETLVMQMFRKCLENDKQVCTLADIRNNLLPKLLSGEIRVKEAEKLVETMT